MRPIGSELALGIDATLEAAERDLSQVRAILQQAIDALVAEYGDAARREGVVALQFQDVSDQVLANASRRIGMVRTALGKDVVAPPHAGACAAGIAAGTTELFQE